MSSKPVDQLRLHYVSGRNCLSQGGVLEIWELENKQSPSIFSKILAYYRQQVRKFILRNCSFRQDYSNPLNLCKDRW